MMLPGGFVFSHPKHVHVAHPAGVGQTLQELSPDNLSIKNLEAPSV